MEPTEITNEMELIALRAAIETALGKKIEGPSDFKELRLFLYQRTGQFISMSTIKRLWQYVDAPFGFRKNTLSVLVRAIGYESWENFLSRNMNEGEAKVSSSPKFGRSVDVNRDLHPGDELKLFWQPGRECHVRYLGAMKFSVIDSKNTRIKAGDTFFCHLIIAGHPLYLSSLTSFENEDTPGVPYICGKLHGGIQFELLPTPTE